MLLIALIAAAFGEDAAPTGSLGIVDRVAAVVNNDVVALSEIYELGSDFIGQKCPAGEASCVDGAELEVLDALIRRVLVRQELRRLQVDVTEAEIDQALDGMVQSYQLGDRQALRTEVEASGKRWDQYREEVRETLRTRKFQTSVLAPRVSVTDDETRDVYQRTARSVSRPVVKLSGIGIPLTPETPPAEQEKIIEQANLLTTMLNSGQMKWDEAVKRYDAGVSAMFADQEFDQDTIIEPLRVVFDAPVGVVQAPIRVANEGGLDVLFVLRVDERTSKTRAAAYEDVKAELENQVFQQKLTEAEEEWYQRARREAAVDIKIGKG